LAWTVRIAATAERGLRSLDRQVQQRIFNYLRDRLASGQNPRRLGKALHGERAGLWRYRVGDYRLICHIDDERSQVVLVAIGHRREIYR